MIQALQPLRRNLSHTTGESIPDLLRHKTHKGPTLRLETVDIQVEYYAVILCFTSAKPNITCKLTPWRTCDLS